MPGHRGKVGVHRYHGRFILESSRGRYVPSQSDVSAYPLLLSQTLRDAQPPVAFSATLAKYELPISTVVRLLTTGSVAVCSASRLRLSRCIVPPKIDRRPCPVSCSVLSVLSCQAQEKIIGLSILALQPFIHPLDLNIHTGKIVIAS